jgi:superfamily II DNA or RNA helicase/HKD family nuclease
VPELDLNSVLNEGAIIDNQRTVGLNKVTLKKILEIMSRNADGMKCSVGYFYLEGLALIIDTLKNLSEIKILMGISTTTLTKEVLIKTLRNNVNLIQDTNQNVSAITNFHKLVNEAKTLQVRIFFGTNRKPERLHSKAYIFLSDVKSSDILKRYYAGIVGSSNLTPSGLVSNTELNVIISQSKDLHYLENWFDNLWQVSSEDFQKLRISHILSRAIEESKFGDAVKHTFVYVKPEEFFKILIRYMNADYLFEDWKEFGLLKFQQVDSIRCLRLFNEKNYRGVFLTSSVGLGKSYVACQCAKYYLRENKKVLLIAPSGLIENEEQWPRYLREFKIFRDIDTIPMGLLQKDPIEFEHIDLLDYNNQYSLIIVDEAHNYRNQNAYRTRNLKKIIDKNGASKILFLTATPINTNFDDLISLIKLFYRPGNNIYFDKLYRGLVEISSIISNKPYKMWNDKEKESISVQQESLERELFIRSTRETVKTSPEYLDEIRAFTGIDISLIHDPDVYEIDYILDVKYKNIINGIVEFISNFTAANFRLFDPEKGAKLGGIFKWILYKRFESDISSYYLTLKRMYKRNTLILQAVDRRDTSVLLGQNMQEDEIDIKFDFDYIEKLAYVIHKIKSGDDQRYTRVLDDLKEDIRLVKQQLINLEVFLQSNTGLLFKDDKKLLRLLEQIKNNLPHKILIFTEYIDTLYTIREFFQEHFNVENIEYIESATKNKSKIIERFNKDSDLRILVATDSISEGYNISGADIIINFDIPYNPVRLIQRIGRATRLDNPKPLKVLNFRPADDIDKELDLLDRLQIRIEDIIRFVGIEYRVWFEREKELLTERRKRHAWKSRSIDNI